MTYPTSLRTFTALQQASEDEDIFYDIFKLGNKHITSRQIREKIAELRCLGLSSFEIRGRMRELFSQFTVDAETIGTKVTAFEQEMSATLDGYRATDATIQAAELKTAPLFKKRVKADESVHSSFQAFVQDRTWEHVVTARVTAKAVEPIATAVGFVAKESVALLLGCRGEGKKNCEALRSFIKQKAKDVVTQVGAKPALKRIMKAEAEIHRLGELGIPEEHAKNYIQDGQKLVCDAANAVAGAWTLRLVKQLIPSGHILGPLTGAKRESRLLSNQHEHRIGTSKITVTKVNEKGQKVVKKTEHPTYYLPPQSQPLGSNKKFSYPKAKSNLSKSSTPLLLEPRQSLPTAHTQPLSTTNNLGKEEYLTTLFEENSHSSKDQDLFYHKKLHIPIFITQTATQVSRGEKTIPQQLDVAEVMRQGLFTDSLIQEYFGSEMLSPIQEFIQANISQPFIMKRVENPQSGNILHIVYDLHLNPIAYVKEFRKTKSNFTGFVPEVVSLSILQAEKFQYASFPTIQDLGWYEMSDGEVRGLIMYHTIPGQTLQEIVKKHLEIPAEEIGQVMGEIHSVTSSLTIPETFINKRILGITNLAESILFHLSLLKISSPFTMKMVNMLSKDVKANPGSPGLVHGDTHPGNILIDNHKVSVIDTGTLVASVNRVGMPLGMPALDQQKLLVIMHHSFVQHGYHPEKIDNIVSRFLTGYRDVLPLAGSESAERFERLYAEIWFLRDCITNPYFLSEYHHCLPIHLERIHSIFGPNIGRSRGEKAVHSVKEESLFLSDRINQVSSNSIYFPSASNITTTPLKTLHDIWSKNQVTLLGIIAKENIPNFGLHGTSYLGIKTILNGKTPISIGGNYLTVAALPYTSSPLDQLGALYAIVEVATGYIGKKGGLFIVSIETAIPTTEGINGRCKIISLDTPLQRRILGKVEGLSHAAELHVPFNESNYAKVIKGLLLEEETLYPEEFVESFASQDHTADWGIVTERLRVQETLITIFEKLGIIRDLSSFPWETYREIGKKILPED